MSTILLRPRVATIEITHADGQIEFASSAIDLADILRREYGVRISKFQAARLANAHPYRWQHKIAHSRPHFELPQGVRIRRLNSTKALRRNLSGRDSGEEAETQSLDRSADASHDQPAPARSAAIAA